MLRRGAARRRPSPARETTVSVGAVADEHLDVAGVARRRRCGRGRRSAWRAARPRRRGAPYDVVRRRAAHGDSDDRRVELGLGGHVDEQRRSAHARTRDARQPVGRARGPCPTALVAARQRPTTPRRPVDARRRAGRRRAAPRPRAAAAAGRAGVKRHSSSRPVRHREVGEVERRRALGARLVGDERRRPSRCGRAVGLGATRGGAPGVRLRNSGISRPHLPSAAR